MLERLCIIGMKVLFFYACELVLFIFCVLIFVCSASSEVRQVYKQFISAVVELMDGVVSEEFREIALNVYRLLCAQIEEDEDGGDKRIAEKKYEPNYL